MQAISRLPVPSNIQTIGNPAAYMQAAAQNLSNINQSAKLIGDIEEQNLKEARYRDAKRLEAIQQGIANERANKELELKQNADARIEDAVARQKRAQKAISGIKLTEPVMEKVVANSGDQEIEDKRVQAANKAILDGKAKAEENLRLAEQDVIASYPTTGPIDGTTIKPGSPLDVRNKAILTRIKQLEDPKNTETNKKGMIASLKKGLVGNPEGDSGRLDMYNDAILKREEAKKNQVQFANKELLTPKQIKPSYTEQATGKVQTIDRDKYLAKVKEIAAREELLPTEYKALVEQADVLFPKAKEPTLANQLSLARLQQSLAKDKQTKAKEDAAAASKKAKEVIATDKTVSALNNMFKQYGAPDVIGTGQQAGIQADTMKIKQKYGLTDSQMSSLVNQAMGQYATGSVLGVDEDGFTTKLEELAGVLTGKK